MSPKTDPIIGLPGFRTEKATQVSGIVEIEVKYAEEQRSCIRCSSGRVWIKASFVRKVRHENMGTRALYLIMRSHKGNRRIDKKIN